MIEAYIEGEKTKLFRQSRLGFNTYLIAVLFKKDLESHAALV
jgi:hypothetical protein